jgi:hypothetical protein
MGRPPIRGRAARLDEFRRLRPEMPLKALRHASRESRKDCSGKNPPEPDGRGVALKY